MIQIKRYGRRNWAVYLNGDLLAVTLYRKGACTVASVLESAFALAGNAVLPGSETSAALAA